MKSKRWWLYDSRDKSFGNGILWTTAVIAMAMVIIYSVGTTPNPGILIAPVIYGLWYRFGR